MPPNQPRPNGPSKRLPLRLTPHEAAQIARVLDPVTYSRTQSDVLRAALRTAYQAATSAMTGRLVYRHDTLHLQEGIWVGPDPTMGDRPEATTDRTVEIRLDADELAQLDALVGMYEFAGNRTHVMRRALTLYCEIVQKLSDGWRFGLLAAAGDFHEISIEGMPSGRDGPVACGSKILFSVLQYFEAQAAKVQDHVEKLIRGRLAEIASRFSAGSAALFLDAGESVVPLCVYNVSRQLPRLEVSGRGIVPHVMRTGRGYYTNNAVSDPYYREDSPTTMSEIAVPVVAGDKVFGCLNLESPERGEFSALDLEELNVEAESFVPHLLILTSVKSENGSQCPWHPDLHGWDLEALFQGICFALADAVDPSFSQSTVWCLDWPKNKAFLYATTGYASDFRFEETMPLSNSKIGEIARGPAAKVWEYNPSTDYQVTSYRERALALGIGLALATRIDLPAGDRPNQAVATLHLHLNQQAMANPGTHHKLSDVRLTLPAVARLIARLVERFEPLRQDVVVAELRHRLRTPRRTVESDFAIIRQYLQVLYAAPGVSLWGRPVGSRELHCVETTGFTRSSDWGGGLRENGPVPDEPSTYHLDTNHGMTTYTALHPGTCYRRENILNPHELGLPADFPARPSERHVEYMWPGYRDQRRLLIGSIGLGDGEPSIGVIRCLRPGRSKPFTTLDERLLSDVLGVARDVFLTWQHARLGFWNPRNEELAPRNRPGAGEKSRPRRLVDDLSRPIPVTWTKEASIEQLLRNLAAGERELSHDILWAALVLRHRSAGDRNRRYRLHAFYSDEYRRPPDGPGDSQLPLRAICPELDWGTLIRDEQIVTFRSPGTPVRTGIRVPVVGWSGMDPVCGVLALDAASTQTWTIQDVDVAFHAAWRLGAIWSISHPTMSSDQVIHPRSVEMGTEELLFRQFPEAIRRRFQLEHCRVVLWDGCQGERRIPDEPAEWLPVVKLDRHIDPASHVPIRSRRKDLALCQVRESSDRTQCTIPLRMGNATVGEFRSWKPATMSEEGFCGLVGAVVSLWAAITFGRSPYRYVSYYGSDVVGKEAAPTSEIHVKQWAVRLHAFDPRPPRPPQPQDPPLFIQADS